MNRSNDEIREIILTYLYNAHKNARSLKSARKKISEIKKELKKYDLKEKEIVSNLDFLIQCGWIKVEEETIEIRTKNGFRKKQSTQYFKISDTGITYFEGASKFQNVGKSYSGINITNVQGVVTFGDNNTIINENYSDLYKELSILSSVVRKSDKLTDEDKLSYVSDIETIKSQLSKKNPDKSIINLAWKRLRTLSDISEIAAFLNKVAKLIKVFL